MKLPGSAWDIGVSSKGDLWIVGTNQKEEGFGIYHWVNSEWVQV